MWTLNKFFNLYKSRYVKNNAFIFLWTSAVLSSHNWDPVENTTEFLFYFISKYKKADDGKLSWWVKSLNLKLNHYLNGPATIHEPFVGAYKSWGWNLFGQNTWPSHHMWSLGSNEKQFALKSNILKYRREFFKVLPSPLHWRPLSFYVKNKAT